MPVRYSDQSAGPSTRRSGEDSGFVDYDYDYSTFTKAELKAAAEEKGVSSLGTKAELIARMSE
jgi:hypothetical protein